MSRRKKISAGSKDVKKTTRDLALDEFRAILSWVGAVGLTVDLRAFERDLLARLLRIGRLLVQLFLEAGDAQIRATIKGPHEIARRHLASVFGKVSFCRTYVRGDEGHGEFPLEAALGFGADLVSPHLLALGTLLAVQMPFEQVRQVLSSFIGYVPSAKTIKQAVLGFGALAQEWLDMAPIPPGDGEVLVTLIDSKGVPTATDAELRKRRGKRRRRAPALSPRHRGRQRRAAWAPKRRRRKGDKSKNARITTVVVMYTLKRQGGKLLGPLNKRVFVTFGPKELAFQWARRQAERRGFGPDSGRLHQVVTDGDKDLAEYTKRHLPGAIHSLDVYHALEYVWEAGGCLHPEGSPELDRWYSWARGKVFGGKTADLLAELRDALSRIPRTGPGNKGRRERLTGAINYLDARLPMMAYKWLVAQDLEIASGGVEGAVNHLVRLRFDHGGMRWIRERAQALLQLRCIYMNGDWEAFLNWALPKLTQPTDEHPIRRILRSIPAPLPELAEAA